MVIIGYDDVRVAIHGTLENAVVVGIGRYHVEDAARHDIAGHLGDHADTAKPRVRSAIAAFQTAALRPFGCAKAAM